MSTEKAPGDDLLFGAKEIARFVLGNDDDQARRQIYSLQDRLPLYRLGDILCGRRSTLSAWMSHQENTPSARHHPTRKKKT